MTSIIRRLQQVRSKPLLFGLYGAVGGFLGALILGEALWWVLRPPKAREHDLTFQGAVSERVSVYQGGTNEFEVKFSRAGYTTPIRLRVTGLPNGISVPDVTIPAEKNDGKITVTADAFGRVGTYQLTVLSVPIDDRAPIAFAAPIELVVLKPDLPPPALRLSVSPEVTVEQGGKNDFGVRIARDHFSGPVTLRFEGMPAGVSVPDVIVPEDKDEAKIMVSATADAARNQSQIGVHGKGTPAGAAATSEPAATDRIMLTVIDKPPLQVDVFFVLDISGSMDWAINGVRDGIMDFVGELEKARIDARVGVHGFRNKAFGDKQELPRFNGDTLTKDFDAFRRAVSQFRDDGGGDDTESSLDAVTLAARQPFRRSATKVLFLITDEKPRIPDVETKSIEDAVRILKENRIDQLHLLVRPKHRAIFTRLQLGAAGEYTDLETATKGATFANLLPKISKDIVRITIASQPPAQPPAAVAAPLLSPPTAAAKEIAPPPPPATIKGVQSDQAFAQESGVQLMLAIGVWTAVIAAGVAILLVVGQHFYLRQDWACMPAATKGFAGGLGAGLLGGVAGQFLFQYTPGASLWEPIFRIVGWTILGSLIGAGMAFFVPNLRVLSGILGGAVGGAAGCAGFLAVSLLLRGGVIGEIGGRLIGAILLGLAIGVMVAWAESIFRSAWLEIRYGGGETRSVNLGPEPISIGSDAKSCTIYARGAPAVAFRYLFRDERITCTDVVTGQSMPMRPGDSHIVGAVEVSVCSGNVPRVPAAIATPRPPAPSAVLTPPPAAPTAVRKPPPTAPRATAKPPPPAPPAVPEPPLSIDDRTEVIRVEARPKSANRPPRKPVAPSTAPKHAVAPAPAEIPDTCPSCGRKMPGRYCLVCDRKF